VRPHRGAQARSRHGAAVARRSRETRVLEAADERLKQWAGTVLTREDALRLSPPAPGDAGGVSLYLLELLARPPARGAPRPHAEVELRYLVSVTAASPEAAHATLGDLFVSAVVQTDFEIEAASPPLAVWQALGVVPRPAFVIRVRARIDLPVARAKPVREPMQVDMRLVVPLQGREPSGESPARRIPLEFMEE
jgi:hypothetical protein